MAIQLSIEHTSLPLEGALNEVYAAIDSAPGVVFSSGFDYPGRHSRWEIGFVNPALELVGRGQNYELRALNAVGKALLEKFLPPLKNCAALEKIAATEKQISLTLKPRAVFFTEEERSRQPSIFSVLRALLAEFSAAPDTGHFGFFGAFGYDLIHSFEEIKLRHERAADLKDVHLLFPAELIVVDRKRECAERQRLFVGGVGPEAASVSRAAQVLAAADFEIKSDHAPGEFAKKVERVIEGARVGDYFEVVLSQEFSAPLTARPVELFQRLARINPSPYLFLINLGDEQLIGSSPEIYVRVTGRRYETCPIAGTVSRGATALEDAAQVRALISSDKDEAELTMCTDVDRNDMARVCVPGSVRVLGRRQLEFYSHVIHTVDHLEGELAENFDSLDAFQTHMWACTVTGAPKPAAVQEIENLENSPRGWYSGAVGYLGLNGDINSGITLRTAHVKNGSVRVRAGATLLFGSDPAAEELETQNKAAAMLKALSGGVVRPAAGAVTVAPRIDKRVLLVDYHDSFVHNLATYLREIGAVVTTLREGFPLSALEKFAPELVFLSPGPAAPEDFGVPALVGELARRQMPTFGVCLGHQGIGQHFGAKLSVLPAPVHGQNSTVEHYGHSLFNGVERHFEVGRYHSLYLEEENFPSCLEITARTVSVPETEERPVVMALRHRELPIAAVQFHPESIMTLKGRAGHRLLENMLLELTAKTK